MDLEYISKKLFNVLRHTILYPVLMTIFFLKNPKYIYTIMITSVLTSYKITLLLIV